MAGGDKGQTAKCVLGGHVQWKRIIHALVSKTWTLNKRHRMIQAIEIRYPTQVCTRCDQNGQGVKLKCYRKAGRPFD